jgi:hypothetical protein
MTDAEKMAERLEKREFPPGSSMFGEYDFLVRLCKGAAALIRRLQAENDTKDALRMQGEAQVASLLVEISSLRAENEALRVKQAGLVEALMPLVDAAHGLSFGTDWNNGTQAKLHGHRQKLIDAVPRARAAIEVNHE